MGELIKIRKLTVEDRDQVTALIEKLVEKIGSGEILNLIVSPEPDAAAIETEENAPDPKDKKYALLVIEIIKLMIQTIGSDVRQWFASLVEVTPEAFKKLPFDTELIILEQLMAVEESDRFFSRLLALVSKIKVYREGLANKSTK